MKSVVLLSGGIDSTVVVAQQLNQGNDCLAVTFDYGQQHRRELLSASAVAHFYQLEHSLVKVPSLFGKSALLGQGVIPEKHAESPDSTVVPARNLVLLSMGAAIADSVGARCLAFGANADDEAGYPDCRRNFVESLRDAIQAGTESHVWLTAPLLGLSKREIVKAGINLGAPLDLTWSCYRGGTEPCGLCGACESKQGAMK